MQTREDKAKEISDISDRFNKAKAAFLVDFKGLDVEKMTKLRMTLTPMQSELRVVKNTLARRALDQAPQYGEALKDEFTGNNAVVFAYEDASAPAKALNEFTKDNEALVIKTGAMDGKKLDESQVKYLATLPGKDQLRAMLLATMQGPMSNMLGLMNNVPGGFVRLLAAYKDQKEKSA